MTHTRAYAKINLGLVVGPIRDDGKHEVVTVLQRIELHDDVTLEPASRLEVVGFEDDTLVRTALSSFARAAGVEPNWLIGIEKLIPVAAGLGGGSSDAAAALSLVSMIAAEPLPDDALLELAAEVGADVPFFLRQGPQLGTGVGTELTSVSLPTDYHVVLLVPDGESKRSTASVYQAFDERNGARGFDRRVLDFHAALSSVTAARDLAALGVQLACVTGLGKGEAEFSTHPGQGGAMVRSAWIPFCDDVAGLLSAADLVVARAGAGSLAEFARIGSPAILIPYPQAADDHQRANAAYFAEQGGGVVLEQNSLAQLTPLATSLLLDDARLDALRAALGRLAAAPALDSGTSELRMAARDEIAALVEKQPEEVAQLLRGWLVAADR